MAHNRSDHPEKELNLPPHTNPSFKPTIRVSTFIAQCKNYGQPFFLRAINSENYDKDVQERCQRVLANFNAINDEEPRGYFKILNDSMDVIEIILDKNKESPFNELKKNYGARLSVLYFINGICEISKIYDKTFLSDIQFSDGIYICPNATNENLTIKNLLHLGRAFGRLIRSENIIVNARKDLGCIVSSDAPENQCTILTKKLIDEITTFSNVCNYFISENSVVEEMIQNLKNAVAANELEAALSLYKSFQEIDTNKYPETQETDINFWMTILYLKLNNKPYHDEILLHLETSLELSQDPVETIFKYFNTIRQIYPQDSTAHIDTLYRYLNKINDNCNNIYVSDIISHEVEYTNVKIIQNFENKEKQAKKEKQQVKQNAASRAKKVKKEESKSKMDANKTKKESEKLAREKEEYDNRNAALKNEIECLIHEIEVIAQSGETKLKMEHDIQIAALKKEIECLIHEIEVIVQSRETKLIEYNKKIEDGKHKLINQTFNAYELKLLLKIVAKGHEYHSAPWLTGHFVAQLQLLNNSDFELFNTVNTPKVIDLNMQVIDPNEFDEALFYFERLGFAISKDNLSIENPQHVNLEYNLQSGIKLKFTISKTHQDAPQFVSITAGKAVLIQTNSELSFKIIDIASCQSSCQNQDIIFNEPSERLTSHAYQIFQCLENYAKFKFPNLENTSTEMGTYTKLGKYYSKTLVDGTDTIYLELHDFIKNRQFSSPKAERLIEITFDALLSHRKPGLHVVLLSQYSTNLLALATKLYSSNLNLFSQDSKEFSKQILNLVVNFINVYPICITLHYHTKTNTRIGKTEFKQIQTAFFNLLSQLLPSKSDLTNLSFELTKLLEEIYTHHSSLFYKDQATTISCINLLVNLYLVGNSKSAILASFNAPIPEHTLFDVQNWNHTFDTKKIQLPQEIVLLQSQPPVHSQQQSRNKPAHDQHRLLRAPATSVSPLSQQMSYPVIGAPIESNSSVPKKKN